MPIENHLDVADPKKNITGTKDEPTGKRSLLRRREVELRETRAELDALKKAYADLQRRFEENDQKIREECSRKEEHIEALRMAELIIEKSPVILFRRLAGEDPHLIYVSDNIRRFGFTAREFLSGKVHFKDIVHPGDAERIGKEIRRYAAENAESYTQVYRIHTKNGDVRWVEDQTTVVRDARGRKTHNQGLVVDVTERKRSEERLKKSEEKFRRIVETTGEGFIMMDEHLSIVDVNDAFLAMLGYQREEILGKTPFDLATPDFRQCISTNKDTLLKQETRRFEGSLSARDGSVVPVLIHGNTPRDDKGAQIGNVAFVSDLTEQKRALALAGRVQRSLRPGAAPRVTGFDIAGRSDACEEVGGDYFDFLFGKEYASKHLKVIIGDVSGHGVDAALLMTSARTFIRTRAAQPGGPARIVTAMNRHLSLQMEDTGHFMTLFLMEFDPAGGSARWVRAGHDPALIYHPGEDVFEELLGTGLPLGVDTEYAYDEYIWSRPDPGAIVVLGTDGIWECVDANGRIFGKKRFRRVIREHAGESAKGIVKGVFDEISRFTEGLPRQDDITLVIIKTT